MMMSDLSVSVQLDQAFQEVDEKIEEWLQQLQRGQRLRAAAWRARMRELTNNLTWKRQRNKYARLMLSQLEAGCFEAPFDALPPASGLPTLQPHWMYRFITTAQTGRYASPPLRQTPMKLKSRPPPAGGLSTASTQRPAAPEPATRANNRGQQQRQTAAMSGEASFTGFVSHANEPATLSHRPGQASPAGGDSKPGAAATAHLHAVLDRFDQRRTQWAVDAALEEQGKTSTSRPRTPSPADTCLDAEASLLQQLDKELEAMMPLATAETAAAPKLTPRGTTRLSKVPISRIFTDLPSSATPANSTPGTARAAGLLAPIRSSVSPRQYSPLPEQAAGGASGISSPSLGGLLGGGVSRAAESPGSVQRVVPREVSTPTANLPAPGETKCTPRTARHTPGCTNLEELLFELQMEDTEGVHDSSDGGRKVQTAPPKSRQAGNKQQAGAQPFIAVTKFGSLANSPSAAPKHDDVTAGVSQASRMHQTPRSTSQPRGTRGAFLDVSSMDLTGRRSVSPLPPGSSPQNKTHSRQAGVTSSRAGQTPSRAPPPSIPHSAPPSRRVNRTGSTSPSWQSSQYAGTLAQQLSPILDGAVSPVKPSPTRIATRSPPRASISPAFKSPERMARRHIPASSPHSPGQAAVRAPVQMSPKCISPSSPRPASPGAEDLQQHEAALQQQLQAVQAAQVLQAEAVSAAVHPVRQATSAFMLVLQRALPGLHAAMDIPQESQRPPSGTPHPVPTKQHATRVLNVAVSSVRASIAEIDGKLDRCEGAFHASSLTSHPSRSPSSSPGASASQHDTAGCETPPWRHAGRALARSPPPARRSPSPGSTPPWVDAHRQAAAVQQLARAATEFSQALKQLEHVVQHSVLRPLVDLADAGGLAGSQALSASAVQLSAAGKAAHTAATVAYALQQLSSTGQGVADELQRAGELLQQVIEPGAYGNWGVSSPRGPARAAVSSPSRSNSPGRAASSSAAAAAVSQGVSVSKAGTGSGTGTWPSDSAAQSKAGAEPHHSTTSVNAKMPLSGGRGARPAGTPVSKVGSTAPTTPSQPRLLPPDVMALLRKASEDGIQWQSALKVAADRVGAAHAHARAGATHNQHTSVLMTQHEPLLPVSLMNDLAVSPRTAHVSPGKRKPQPRDQSRPVYRPEPPAARPGVPTVFPGQHRARSLLPPDLLADVLADHDLLGPDQAWPLAARDSSPAARRDLIPSSPDVIKYKRGSPGVLGGRDQQQPASSPAGHISDAMIGGIRSDMMAYGINKAAYSPTPGFKEYVPYESSTPSPTLAKAVAGQLSPGTKPGTTQLYRQLSPVAKVVVTDLNAEYRQAMHQLRVAETDNTRQLEAFKTAKRSLAITDLPAGFDFRV